MDSSLDLIDPAAGKPVTGLKQTMKAITAGSAAKVFLAEDCEDAIRELIVSECESKGIELVRVPMMRSLGKMCGIDVKASCAAQLRK